MCIAMCTDTGIVMCINKCVVVCIDICALGDSQEIDMLIDMFTDMVQLGA